MQTTKINNIAELKTRRGTSNSTVNVLGYYTSGDGGGGEFYWDNTSLETENGGTIIEVTGLTTGRWKRIYSKEVNVKWFGAKGDGINDDTTSIRNSLLNKCIYIPTGNYKITSTIELESNTVIYGDGVASTYILGYTGDTPIFSRQSYSNPNATGSSDVCIKNIRINDYATSRTSYYSIDLTNGNSNILQDLVFSAEGSIQGITPLSDKYGAILGLYPNSTFTGETFLHRVDNCRFKRSKVVMNCTDWYIINSEIWGNERDFAVMITGGGHIGNGTQLVGGETYGAITLNHFSNFNIENLKITGVFFDGSYTEIDTNSGITSYLGYTGSLVNSVINGCTFWHHNKAGIDLYSAWGCSIVGNVFSDCNAANGTSNDIKIADSFSNVIINNHSRALVAPKTGVNRTNFIPVLNITAKAGFPYSTIGGGVVYSSTYSKAIYIGEEFNIVSSEPLLSKTYSTIPNYNDFIGIAHIGGKVYYNSEVATLELGFSQDANVEASIDLNTIITTRNIYSPTAGLLVNKPASVTTSFALVKTYFITTGYAIQELYSGQTNIIYHRSYSAGSWGAWS